jgi:Alpha/beta-hydrolase family
VTPPWWRCSSPTCPVGSLFPGRCPQAAEAGKTLQDGVLAWWSRLPPGSRPRLVIFAESLGTYGSESGFAQADTPRWLVPSTVCAPPRGYDVSPRAFWFPIVTGIQSIGDLAAVFGGASGHGHNYSADVTSGWAAVAPPEGVERCREPEASGPPRPRPSPARRGRGCAIALRPSRLRSQPGSANPSGGRSQRRNSPEDREEAPDATPPDAGHRHR